MHRVYNERRYLIPFRATLLPQIFTDTLVIGAGVAGLRAALEAAKHGDVIVVHKRELRHSATNWAQGGIAAVLDEQVHGGNDLAAGDDFQQHIEDTITAGAGLCDEPTVRQVVEAAPARIGELMAWGMRLDRTEQAASGPLALGREGGHSFHRIVHTDGDATGRELSRTLGEAVQNQSGIRLFDECFVLDLITVDGSASEPGCCVGAITHHPKYGLQVIWTSATVLATGGCGQVYRETTNPGVATGDGLAMAYRAGAALADMAFMQFHPTTLYVAGASRSLITEAVRGEGAHLIDHDGYRFMPDYHELAELAPRDVVSRAILAQMERTSFTHVYLDCRHIGGERFAARFPGISKLLEQFEIEPGVDPIPIRPAAHYMIGGVRTDAEGRSNIRGLYACGEVSCTGLHGANRLASNSLLEGLVYGEIVGRVCGEMINGAPPAPMKIVSDISISDRSELDVADVRSTLRSVMWRRVGIERDGSRLAEVAEMFDFWARYTLDKIFDDRAGWEVQNLLLVGALVTRAARWREESRGTHYRLDFPETLDAFHVHDIWSRDSTEPDVEPVQASEASAL